MNWHRCFREYPSTLTIESTLGEPVSCLPLKVAVDVARKDPENARRVRFGYDSDRTITKRRGSMHRSSARLEPQGQARQRAQYVVVCLDGGPVQFHRCDLRRQ